MILFLLAACGEDPSTTHDVAWYPEVQAIVQEACIDCHAEGRGAFPLDDPDVAVVLADEILDAVVSGAMPPWPADADCREFVGERGLDDAQIATLEAWVDAGAPVGDPASGLASKEPAPLATLEGYTHELTTVAYAPDAAGGDDWHCSLLSELEVDGDVYVTGVEILAPSELVHHVQIAIIPADQRELVEELDAENEGGGYSCVGSALPTEDLALSSVGPLGLPPERVARWTPGFGAQLYPEGTAVRVPEGSLLVAQQHFSGSGSVSGDERTRVRLQVTDEPPERLVVGTAISVTELMIPPGEAGVSFSESWPYYGTSELEIRSLTGHMHLFGERFSASASGAGEDQCLLDIPTWDYAWQLQYETPSDAPIRVASGSQVELTCVYDNSAENQPWVDGEQQEPETLRWGENVTDEMCFLMFERVEDHWPLPAPGSETCASVASCGDTCAGDLDCVLRCETLDMSCYNCAMRALSASETCELAAASGEDCLAACSTGAMLMGGSVAMCLEAECPDAYADLLACAEEPGLVVSEEAAACGLAL